MSLLWSSCMAPLSLSLSHTHTHTHTHNHSRNFKATPCNVLEVNTATRWNKLLLQCCKWIRSLKTYTRCTTDMICYNDTCCWCVTWWYPCATTLYLYCSNYTYYQWANATVCEALTLKTCCNVLYMHATDVLFAGNTQVVRCPLTFLTSVLTAVSFPLLCDNRWFPICSSNSSSPARDMQSG